MALTTASQTEYSLPGKPQKISQEAAILLDKSIVARPLIAPEVASIRVIKTEFYYRWVNRQHQNGLIYNQRKAMGFTNATTDDAELLVGDAVVNDAEFRCGDLILMKIPFVHWAAHVKRNMQVAEALQRTRGVATKEENLSSDIHDDSGRPNLSSLNDAFKGKVGSFEVANADSYVDGQSERQTEKAKAVVADIRNRISASPKTSK